MCLSVPSVRAGKVVDVPTRGIFGLKAGVISRANIRGDRHLHTEVGSTGQVYTDFPLTGHLYFSTAFDFYYVELVRDNDVMIDGSLGLKCSFPLKRADMELRPGIAIGYGYLPDINTLRATDYLTIKLFLETHFPFTQKKAWIGELAVMGAPTGGNGSYDLTLGPAYMLRVGLAFR